MFDSAFPALACPYPSLSELERTAQVFQRQVELLGEKVAANPGDEQLCKAWVFAMEKLAELAPHQKEVALARQETARHNDTEWTARNQSCNATNVQIVQSNNWATVETNRSFHGSQARAQEAAQFTSMMDTIGQHPQAMQYFLQPGQGRLQS